MAAAALYVIDDQPDAGVRRQHPADHKIPGTACKGPVIRHFTVMHRSLLPEIVFQAFPVCLISPGSFGNPLGFPIDHTDIVGLGTF